MDCSMRNRAQESGCTPDAVSAYKTDLARKGEFAPRLEPIRSYTFSSA
jgi:hypothetical protein